jgi:hypothetical protein
MVPHFLRMVSRFRHAERKYDGNIVENIMFEGITTNGHINLSVTYLLVTAGRVSSNQCARRRDEVDEVKIYEIAKMLRCTRTLGQ